MLKPVLSLTCLLLMPFAALAQDAPKPVSPDEIEWRDAPPVLPAGAEIAVLSGDPAKEGPFVVRLKLPEGYRIPAHSHSAAEFITVISGRFSIGMGDTFDTDEGERLRRGGFVELPANMNHYAWTRRGAVIQVHGEGPFAMTYANPADDPRNHRMSDRLNEVIGHLQADGKRVTEPQGKALFETAADVLGGLVTAFRRYEDKKAGKDDDDNGGGKEK